MLALKASHTEDEVEDADKAIQILGGKLIKDEQLSLPVSGDERHLVWIEKVTKTPKKYPRKPGTPNREPIVSTKKEVVRMTSKAKTSMGAEKLLRDEDSKQVVEINLSHIHPNPYQPRHNFDAKALRELANSIQESGVFQPIIVRQQAAAKKYYELIAGERRFRLLKWLDCTLFLL